MGDAADGPSRKIKVLRRNGTGVVCVWGGGGGADLFSIRSAIFS